jgi:hypothetical protein
MPVGPNVAKLRAEGDAEAGFRDGFARSKYGRPCRLDGGRTVTGPGRADGRCRESPDGLRRGSTFRYIRDGESLLTASRQYRTREADE